ncbi:3-oxoacyl-ACP synthase III family protein [Metabacillus fastidiosus]|uniref:3-oxoacyl-ACP synthase III family protein n=1 Tax=Metabacillus fastidiosus TaxID=1458 RepID=UPI003D294E4C
MYNVKIAGVGSFLPGRPITNRDMEHIFKIREDWIEDSIGTKTRYFATNFENKKIEYTLTDLCEKAALEAIEKASIGAKDIELIVMSTATPDHLMPATVNLVADRLEINNIPTYQIQAGCSGALQGLEIAYRFLRSGVYRTALVIGGDVCNKYIDVDRDFTKLRGYELINYALFGDGAGATVLTAEDGKQGIAIHSIQNCFEGLGREPGQVMNWFGTVPEKIDEMSMRDRRKVFQSAKEDYKAIEKNVPLMAKEMIDKLLNDNNWKADEIDFYLPPQLGGHMTDKIVQYLEIDDKKVINCVAYTGNNGNGLPYIQLKQLIEKMNLGDKAIGVAIESSKWIKTGISLIRE